MHVCELSKLSDLVLMTILATKMSALPQHDPNCSGGSELVVWLVAVRMKRIHAPKGMNS